MLIKKLKLALIIVAFAALALFGKGYVDALLDSPVAIVVADGGVSGGPPGGG